jgi:hypothetical protein
MSFERLPTDLWVRAHVRQYSLEGIPVAIIKRGDQHRGTVIIKINRLEAGCAILTQTSDLEGNIAWLAALDGSLVPEAEANAYIERQVTRDTDLWVVEVEDREGRCLFDGKLL